MAPWSAYYITTFSPSPILDVKVQNQKVGLYCREYAFMRQ
jgi:hypothetical protein